MKARAWDQRKGEPADAFAAFREYRDAGPARTVRTLSYAIPLIQDWFQRWRWTRRVEAYDAFVNATLHEELQKTIRDYAKTQAPKLEATMAHMLEFLHVQAQKLAKELTGPGISVMKPRDLVACVDAYAKLRELLAGRPTERVEELRYDEPRLSDEDFARLREIEAKVREPVAKH